LPSYKKIKIIIIKKTGVRLRSDVFGERERESCAISMKKTWEREKRTGERETIIFFFF
jgi:hypothetical protein